LGISYLGSSLNDNNNNAWGSSLNKNNTYECGSSPLFYEA
jgi:hypothetical protein